MKREIDVEERLLNVEIVHVTGARSAGAVVFQAGVELKENPEIRAKVRVGVRQKPEKLKPVFILSAGAEFGVVEIIHAPSRLPAQ